MSNQDRKPLARLPKSREGKILAALLGVAVLLGGTFALQAASGSNAYAHMKVAAGGGWHHGGKRFSEMTDAEINQRITRAVKHVAIEIDANDEQSEKIAALISAVALDVRESREAWLDAGKEMREAFLQDNVDRERLERLRTERMAEANRVSAAMVTALADAAEVLTPEQRRVLENRIEEFRSMRSRWYQR